MNDRTAGTAIDIRDAFFDELYEIARRDQNLIFMTADMGAQSLERFKRDLPAQYFNVGIAEQNLVSVAAGLALSGKRVFIYAIIPFVTLRCLEQIKVDLCLMKLPVTIIGSGPGFTYSNDGPTHHALEDISIMRALPGMTIYNPCDHITAGLAARYAALTNQPVYIRLDKGSYPPLYTAGNNHSTGLAQLRRGRKLLIITTGGMTHMALGLAGSLEEKGLDPGVVDLFRVKPLDRELVDIAEGYEKIVTLEEHTLPGGLGGAVVELFSDHGLLKPVRRLGLHDIYPGSYGDRDHMRRESHIDPQAVENEVASLFPGTQLSLGLKDFARSFGTSPDTLPEACVKLIESFDFRYIRLEGNDREQVVLEVLKKIDGDQQLIAAPARKAVWNKGWSENLKEFIAQEGNLSTLVPKFLRPSNLFRLFGDYVRVVDPEFELHFIRVLRSWLFRTYFSSYNPIYEFGSGTGHNLVELAHLFPNKELVGLDFVPSSCELIRRLGTDLHYRISSQLFNMMEPDWSHTLKNGSLLFTFGVIEQLGSCFEKFLDYVVENRVGLCVHIEPVLELYEERLLFDHLAAKFHRKRGYTVNFLPRLQQLEQAGEIELLKVKRLHFGSLMMEGYSLIIWKPR